MWIANHRAVYPHEKLADDLTAQALWTWSSPIVDLLGVRWVLAPSDRPIDARSFVKAFSGSDGVDVWRNDDAYANGLVVYRTRVAVGDAAQAAAVADKTFHPSRFAVVEHAIAGVPELKPGEASPLPNEQFACYREGAYGLAVEVVAAAPGVLVMSEPWYPGWRVTVDDRPAELRLVSQRPRREHGRRRLRARARTAP